MLDISKIDDILYPALILDNNLIIKDKNKAASAQPSIFRRGSSLKNHVKKADFIKILSLKNGENITVCIKSAYYLSAVVYRLDDIYILKTCVLAVELINRLSELNKIQESCLTECMALLVTDEATQKRLVRKMRKILMMQNMLNDYFRIIRNTKDKNIRVYDLGSQMNYIIKYAADIMKLIKIKINYTTSKNSFLVKYNSQDMDLICFGILAVLGLLSSDDSIYLKNIEDEENIVFAFSTDYKNNKNIKKLLKSESYDMLLFSEENGEVFFILEYIKRLIEFYGYSFDFNFISKNTMQILVGIPKMIEGGDSDITVSENQPQLHDYSIESTLLVILYDLKIQ